ncbi:MAG: hypothetical protein RL196_814 [Actinomycetota bacterium]|jgi:aminoglycoside phosphotransferase (APT) family kinase protein
MGKSPLILAALAKDAAAGLNFVKVVKPDVLNSSDYDGALLTADDGKHYLIRIAKNPTAQTNQDIELRALKALAKPGTLPFALSSLIASTTTREGETVRVMNYVYGQEFDLAELSSTSALVESSAKALAAIHNLPLSVVQDNGFPEYSTSDILRSTAAELDRAMETGKVPSVLLNRWEDALSNENLFRFMPTVIHGHMNESMILETDNEISGVLDWSELQIGDPARDFGWVVGRGHDDVIYNLLLAYQRSRPAADNNVRQRAQLYHELAWATWLVAGVNKNNEEIVEEALGELELIASQVEAGTALRLTPTTFASAEVANEPFESDSVQTPSIANATKPLEFGDLAESREPIFASSNFDMPVVDFADTDTAPIEIIDTSSAQQLPEGLPNFLSDEADENVSDSKDELF